MLGLHRSAGVCLHLLGTSWLSRRLLGPTEVCWGLLRTVGQSRGLLVSAEFCRGLLRSALVCMVL